MIVDYLPPPPLVQRLGWSNDHPLVIGDVFPVVGLGEGVIVITKGKVCTPCVR